MSQLGERALVLLVPSLDRLPAEALGRGWSPDNVRDVSAEHLAKIRQNAAAFLACMLSQSGTIQLPDGSKIPKLPHRTRWMWDGDFAGQISLRWQPGTDALPSHVLGHVGYAVVPWKQGRGYATRALGLILTEAIEVGLRGLEITTEQDNAASRHVIERNGGRLAETFTEPHYGGRGRLRYRIDLAAPMSAEDRST